MKIVIVGLGSIAKKHISALRLIDPSVLIYAFRSRLQSLESTDKDVINIYSKNEIPEGVDFYIISNPTSEHAKTILDFLPSGKPLFIEKPVLMDLDQVFLIKDYIKEKNSITYVACNLRFHPIIKLLKAELENRKPIEFNVYCGSFLPEWRPEQDYSKNYSAIKAMGGGAHLDLIHEIDYTFFLLGKPDKLVVAYTDKKSNLDIDSIDIAHFVLDYSKTSVFITLNYYRRFPKRSIELVWEDDIWIADLLNNTIVSTKTGEFYREDYSIQATYLEQMQYFTDCLNSNKSPMNNFDESIEVLKLALNGN